MMQTNKTVVSIQVGNLDRIVHIPRSWNDLDVRSMMLYYATLFDAPGAGLAATALTALKLISMTKHMLQLTDDQMRAWRDDCVQENPQNGDQLFYDELRQIIHTGLAGLFDIEQVNGETKYACKLNLTRNPYPTLIYTVGKNNPVKKALFAPADGLANISIYELAMLFSAFEAYVQTNDEQHANRLIATMYRPSRPKTREEVESGWKGDRRQPIRHYESKIEERARLVGTMPVLTRRVILFWFASCRQQIINTFPKVFVRSSEGGHGPGYGWGGVLLALAGGPTGLDAISDQHYGNALTWLSMKEDERKEQEKRIEKARARR